MDEKDKNKTVFITRNDLFNFRVLPFGVANSPACFKLKVKKCHMLKAQVEFLGFVVSPNGVETDYNKIKEVRESENGQFLQMSPKLKDSLVCVLTINNS